MRSSTILACISVLVFVQLIDCKKDSILSSFVEKLKKKALKNGVNIGTSLDFVVQFSNTIDKVNKKLDVSAHEFMNDKKIEEIKRRIPSQLKVIVYDPIEANAREFIQNSINSINRASTVNIPNAKNEVRSEIAFKPTILYDKILEKWNKVWENDPITTKHLQNVNEELQDVPNQHRQMVKRFDEILKAMEVAEAGVQKYLGPVNTEFGKLLKLDPKNIDDDKVKEIIVGIQPSLDNLFKQQNLVIENVQGLKNILTLYNKNRIACVEFAVSMRETHTSERTESMSLERIKANFPNTSKMACLASHTKE